MFEWIRKRSVESSSLHKLTIWFLLFNGMMMLLTGLTYLKSMPATESWLSILFLTVSFVGHFIATPLLLFPLFYLLNMFLPSRKLLSLILIIAASSANIILIIDSLVFAQYRFHLNGMVLNLITGGAVREILPLTSMVWFSAVLLLIFIFILEYLILKLSIRISHQGKKSFLPLLIALSITALVSANLIHSWGDAVHYTAITRVVRYIPAFKPLTMKRALAKIGIKGSSSSETISLKQKTSALQYPVSPLTFDRRDQFPNILMIVIDSWRYDTLTPEITPNIWKFSKESWRFDNHFSSSNSTRFGIFGLMYGIDGTYWHSVIAEERGSTFIHEMLARNYSFKVLASAPLTNPEFDRTVFAEIRDRIELRQPGGGAVANDRIITDKMINFIGTQKSPFFGFIFLDSPHTASHPDEIAPFKPYSKEINHITLNNSTDPVPYFNKYKNAVYFNDMLIGRLIGKLKKAELLDSTIVIITGDHGEEFNDLKKNYWGHVGNFSRFQTMTPLVVRWAVERPEVYTHTSSHLDIVPTIMNKAFGCTSAPSVYSNGRYLTDTSSRQYVMLSSWGTFALYSKDMITVFQQNGEMDLLDMKYNPIKNAGLNAGDAKEAMQEMSRFYKR